MRRQCDACHNNKKANKICDKQPKREKHTHTHSGKNDVVVIDIKHIICTTIRAAIFITLEYNSISQRLVTNSTSHMRNGHGEIYRAANR